MSTAQYQAKHLLREYGLSIILVVVALSITIILLLHVKSILIIALLMLIGSLSHIHMRFISWIGLELCLVVTICLGWLFGPVVGMIGGFITVVIADILGACVSETSLVSYTITALVGFVCGFFGGLPLLTVGIIATFFYSVITASLYIGLGLAIPVRAIGYAVTHTLFSWWVLWIVTPALATLA